MLVTDSFGLLPLGNDVSLHFVPLSVAVLAYIDTVRAHEHVGHLFAVGESHVAMDSSNADRSGRAWQDVARQISFGGTMLHRPVKSSGSSRNSIAHDEQS